MIGIPSKIGAVQIDTEHVRLAVLRTGGREPQVLDLVEVEILGDTDASRVSALRDAHSRLRAHPAAWVLMAPATWSVFRLITVPFRSPRKIAAAVPFELEPALAVPIDSLVVNHLPARVSGNETQVLAVGVRRDALAAHVALAEQAGIAVEGAYLDAVALTSFWISRHPRQSGARAVLHFRPGEVSLGIVEDRRLAYLRRLDSDPLQFRTAPMQVAREVRNLLRAYSAESGGAAPIDSIAVTGAQLHEAGRTIFEGELDLRVDYEELAEELPGFARCVDAADAMSDEFNRWSAVIAAAANAGGGPFHMNLLRGGMAESGRAQRGMARAAFRACAAGAAVLAAYLLLVILDQRRASHALDRYGDEIWEQFEAVYPDLATMRPANDRGGAESFRLLQEAAIAESSSSLNVPLDVFSAPPLLDVLLEVSTAFDPGVAKLDDISIRPLRQYRELTISGQIVDSARYNEAVEKLDSSALLDVNRDQSTRVTEGGRESFRLRARL